MSTLSPAKPLTFAQLCEEDQGQTSAAAATLQYEIETNEAPAWLLAIDGGTDALYYIANADELGAAQSAVRADYCWEDEKADRSRIVKAVRLVALELENRSE